MTAAYAFGHFFPIHGNRVGEKLFTNNVVLFQEFQDAVDVTDVGKKLNKRRWRKTISYALK